MGSDQVMLFFVLQGLGKAITLDKSTPHQVLSPSIQLLVQSLYILFRLSTSRDCENILICVIELEILDGTDLLQSFVPFDNLVMSDHFFRIKSDHLQTF